MRSDERLPEEQWRLIRRMYENATGVTVSEIAAMAGTTETPIYRRARLEGWSRNRLPGGHQSRPARAAPALATLSGAIDAVRSRPVPNGPDGDDPLNGDPDRQALIAGLWRAVQLHVAELSGPAGGMTGEASSGRAAQTLMTIARTVEKLMEMERADASADLDAAGIGGGGTGPAGPGGGANDADAFRDALAARLEALLRERLARDDLRDDGDDLGADAPGDPAGDLPAAAGGDH